MWTGVSWGAHRIGVPFSIARIPGATGSFARFDDLIETPMEATRN